MSEDLVKEKNYVVHLVGRESVKVKADAVEHRGVLTFELEGRTVAQFASWLYWTVLDGVD